MLNFVFVVGVPVEYPPDQKSRGFSTICNVCGKKNEVRIKKENPILVDRCSHFLGMTDKGQFILNDQREGV